LIKWIKSGVKSGVIFLSSDPVYTQLIILKGNRQPAVTVRLKS